MNDQVAVSRNCRFNIFPDAFLGNGSLTIVITSGILKLAIFPVSEALTCSSVKELPGRIMMWQATFSPNLLSGTP